MNHLALPLKITICWELLIIILLEIFLFSVTMYNFEQSAGNQRINLNILVGTSETTRDPHKSFMRRYSPWNKNSLINLYNYNYNLKYNKNNVRLYSSFIPKSIKEDNIKNLEYIKRYENFEEDRSRILKEEKVESGVYCLINNTNGHSYVGSSNNLASRMKNYLNNSFLKSRQNINMPIVKALLKYGQSNFTLLILEYIETESLTIRETFYITHIMPHYNVLKQGYSSLGYKHTEETKNLLSELATNRIHSESTKSLISRALIGENNPFYNKNHSTETKVRMIEANSNYPVYVYDSLKNLLVIFPSVFTLSKLIHSNHPTLVKVIKEQTIFRGEWYLSNIPYNLKDTPIISSWSSEESKKLVSNINDQVHIKKAIFVYDEHKNLLSKYEGVTKAQAALGINHVIIKKHAKTQAIYNGYIFSYERLTN
uniref:GIY-YIG endonuclease n=1 Tax=Niveomyces insectorum TaxID=150359 RepID=A0A6B9DDY2_9HYPO|nr:GIY-YIG endonuclease [Niveomyces insectorum]